MLDLTIFLVDMASPSSPLYAFDSQLWERLLFFVAGDDLCQLVLAGDSKVSTKCITAIRSLSVTCKAIECHILSRALASNLKTLKMALSGIGNRIKNVLHVSHMIHHSNLTELVLQQINPDFLQMTLPPTLKKLYIESSQNKTFKHLSLGNAKISQLRINHTHNGYSTVAFCDWMVHALVLPFAATLENLTFSFPTPVAIDLSSHTLLTCLSININYFSSFPMIKPPPLVRELILTGDHCKAGHIQSAISAFGQSLKNVTLDILQIHFKTLDVSEFGHIELLKMSEGIDTIICAPTTHLRIVCWNHPSQVVNRGSGSVVIQSKSLILLGGDFPNRSVLEVIDWSRIKDVELSYSGIYGYCIAPNVDYGPLRQAINATKLFIRWDTMEGYVARDGPRFLQVFPQLRQLEWTLDAETCINLALSGFSLPASLKSLTINFSAKNVLSDRELIHLLDWLKHVPEKVCFMHFPFIPKIVSLCNDTTSLVQLNFVCVGGISTSIWTDDAPIFAPSPNMVQASFIFYGCSQEMQVPLLQKIFGSNLCNVDKGRVQVIYDRQNI